MASSSLQDSEQMMKDACELSWKQVNKNQAMLKSCANQHRPIGESQDAMSVIAELKVKCLQGEIDAVKNRPVSVLPNDPVILEAVLKEQLETCVSQLEECLVVVEGRRRELEDDVAREEELVGQHEALKRAMESRLQEAQQGGNQLRPSQDSQVRLLRRKQKNAAEMKRNLLKEIKEFVEKHYPRPTQREQRQLRYSSLLEIIELLMNKGLHGELDPYMPINEAFWPPYVELLLRCGIASRHPQDCNRIRLVPFHL